MMDPPGAAGRGCRNLWKWWPGSRRSFQTQACVASSTPVAQYALSPLPSSQDMDEVDAGSPAVRQHHESAILATVDKGMQAAKFLEFFGQRWREATREQGVEGLAKAQGMLEALVELLEYVVVEIDWLKPTNLHTKLHQLAATALATTFDPWAECLPPHDTIERAQYQQRVAPLMLRLASSLSEAANGAIDTCQGRRPSPGQREKAAVGLLPRLALRLPLVVILVQQASEEIPEQGEEQHGPGAGAGSTQAPYPASVPPGSRSPSRLAPTVSLDDVVPLAESAVRYAGKAREVLRLAPAVPHLEERLAEGVGHLTGVLTALLDDALGTVQTAALPAEAAAELLPDLKGLLASCCKLAVLGSQAGRPLLLDEEHLPRLGWLVVRAAHLMVEVLLLKAGAASQLMGGLDDKSLKDRMRNFGFVPMASVPALLAVKRSTQELGVLEQDAADMARYVTQLGRLGVLDEAARAGLGELLATELRLHLEPRSLASNPAPYVLLTLCGRLCLKEDSTRLVVALVRQGLLSALVEWCGQQMRVAEHEQRGLAAASILLKTVCTHLDKTSAQPGLMPIFSRILPNIPDPTPDLRAQADPLASMAPYQAALQPGPWRQVQAELLPQLQEVCKERAASVEAAEPQLDGICRDLALSSFTCCAPSCTNLAGMSDLEVELSKCTGCRAARYCSRGCQRQDWRRHKPICAAINTRRGQASPLTT